MQQHTVQTPYMVGEVHFYSAGLPSGPALFDTGPPLEDGLSALGSAVDLIRLKNVFITHCHVDHYGLANYILQNSDAEIYIPRKDAIKLSRHNERMAAMVDIIGHYGFDKSFVSQLRESFEKNKIFPTTPECYRIVEESDLTAHGISWLSCPGHSQSDLVYILDGCAVTGDTLLTGIFQAPLLDIDLESFDGRFRNYEAYCSSLLNLAKLRGLKILPGHRRTVESVDEVIRFYVTTLLERSLQLVPLRHLPMAQIIDRIFKGRLVEPFFVYLKLSELVFMLDFLENPELLQGALEDIGLFGQVGELFEKVISSCKL